MEISIACGGRRRRTGSEKARIRNPLEWIVTKLRQAEILVEQGKSVAEVIGVTELTYYHHKLNTAA